MNIHRILKTTRAEGPGVRFCVWLQGCSRHCEGCFAVDTWSHAPRIQMSAEELLGQIMAVQGIEGITVLGGEPFEQADELAQVIAAAHRKLSVIVFTGYTLRELQEKRDPYIDRILADTDVLIDGAYVKEQRSFSRPMVGSDNQNFHFLTDRYKIKDFPPNTVEVRIRRDGTAELNGMGDFEKIMRRLGKK